VTEKALRIALASDHAGFELKQQLVAFLQAQGYVPLDLGPGSSARVDYPDYAQKVAAAVADGSARYGVLVCGTGIGMAIAANKVAGIRAANVTTPEFAALAREHNDANVLTLSARFVAREINEAIVLAFLGTPFGGGRHAERVARIGALEQG
jgi:ribose 5-phosphate isomerase B